jgi:hypothetical protein
MAEWRTSRDMIEQVLQMYSEGRKIRAIERCTNLSRNTVRKIIREHESKLEKKTTDQQVKSDDWRDGMNWELIQSEASSGVTIKVLHQEHAPAGVNYKKFWDGFWNRCELPPEITMRLIHKPGEKTFFDFCDGLSITDRKTGKKTKTQFFCGALDTMQRYIRLAGIETKGVTNCLRVLTDMSVMNEAAENISGQEKVG